MSDDTSVRRVRPAERVPGQPTAGMRREEAVATDRLWAGYVTTDAGSVSGWHHHGDYETSIYVVAGTLRMESGPGGAEVMEAVAGDFVHVPPHAIHREGNPSEETSALVVVRSGEGEAVINVEGPAPD
jgi:uncharacterized RmlC-like cupin family protein